jgi:beta-N-acetylhexosaminidase
MNNLLAAFVVLLVLWPEHAKQELVPATTPQSAGLMTPRPAPKKPVARPAKPSGDQATLRRMIGQMIMVGFSGQHETDAGVVAVREQLAKGQIGGVILFRENIRSAKALRSLNTSLREAKPRTVPFIAVDQEGGTVQRLSRQNGHRSFPSARQIARAKGEGPEKAEAVYAEMAAELAEAGFNVNFAPVVDLDLNPRNPIIGKRRRSYGADPEVVSDYARALIRAHRASNVLTAAKHFPGHGSSLTDSHKILVDVSDSWQESELEPYAQLQREGLLDMVMTGHLYHPRFSEGDRVPASLSRAAIDELRALGGIGFQGIVVSDDLEMRGVSQDFSLEERIVRCINAGTDLLVISNVQTHEPELGARVHDIVAQAVTDGRIDRARIEESYGRILTVKERLMREARE